MGTLVPGHGGHQDTVTLGPGPREFLFLFLRGIFFPEKKIGFLCFFSLFLSLSLFICTPVWVLLSSINFTKVSCEG
jgi:hypothetical protein